MTEQETDSATHWGAPDPSSTVPVAHGGRRAARKNLRAKLRLLFLSYTLLGAAGLIAVVGGSVLVSHAFRPAAKQQTAAPDRNFSIQGLPGPRPTESPGQRISPAGAPYSYLLPQGFAAAPVPKSSATGQAGVYETAATPRGATGGDIVAVSVYRLGANSDPFSYDQLQEEIDRLARKVAPTPGTAERVSIADARALRYVFNYGTTKVVNYFVFSRTTEIQVRCQWTRMRPAIEKGCGEVISSLELR